MTERIFDSDSHASSFFAKVLSCLKCENGYEIVLDRTAFFPLGGGQQPDTGLLGDAHVIDVREKDRIITHITDLPLEVGSHVNGCIDWSKRFARMQNHSGEHIVSGIIHNKYGFENVGFHMGSEDVTIDISGELSYEQINEIEYLANEVVWRNVPITAYYPDETELATLNYRSKLELTENVRIVKVEGYDMCACCAPHVSRTGEIGIIKLLDFIRYKGGVRIHMLCGSDALADYRNKFRTVQHISNTMSVKQADTGKAVDLLNEALVQKKHELITLKLSYARVLASQAEATQGAICLFSCDLDADALREYVNLASPKCKLCAAFSGSDKDGWNYVIGSESLDMRAETKKINAGISGRGGGSTKMIQGRTSAQEAEIKAFFDDYFSADQK